MPLAALMTVLISHAGLNSFDVKPPRISVHSSISCPVTLSENFYVNWQSLTEATIAGEVISQELNLAGRLKVKKRTNHWQFEFLELSGTPELIKKIQAPIFVVSDHSCALKFSDTNAASDLLTKLSLPRSIPSNGMISRRDRLGLSLQIWYHQRGLWQWSKRSYLSASQDLGGQMQIRIEYSRHRIAMGEEWIQSARGEERLFVRVPGKVEGVMTQTYHIRPRRTPVASSHLPVKPRTTVKSKAGVFSPQGASPPTTRDWHLELKSANDIDEQLDAWISRLNRIPDLRRYVASALRNIPEQKAYQARLVYLLEECKHLECEKSLVQLLDSRSDSLRAQVLSALGDKSVLHTESIEALSEVALSEQAQDASVALLSIGRQLYREKIARLKGERVLRQALKSEVAGVKDAAILAMGVSGNSLFREDLYELIGVKSSSVRRLAGEQLIKLGNEVDDQAMMSLFESEPDPFVRSTWLQAWVKRARKPSLVFITKVGALYSEEASSMVRAAMVPLLSSNSKWLHARLLDETHPDVLSEIGRFL